MVDERTAMKLIMKLLIDQNISYRLLGRIIDIFPNATHIKNLNLWDSDDYEIFMVAREQGFDAIVTIDADFVSLNQQFGVPPKIIWIRTGNVSTGILADVLRIHTETIREFLLDESLQCLQIFR
jgi:predicted nuclease of predicted toxin-antitoxin system